MFSYRNHVSNGTSVGMVNTAIVGPLSHNSPSVVSNLNNGEIVGSPLQVDSSERNPMSRQMLFRTIQTKNHLFNQRSLVLSDPRAKHMNYIKPMDSSMRISMLKGQSYASNRVVNSTKNYTPSTTSSHLQRCRSSGCVPPKKKGAVY